MKKFFFTLGLSVTILLSAAFAQPAVKKSVEKVPTATFSISSNVKKPSLLTKFNHKKINPNFSGKKKPVSPVRYMACYPSPKATGKATVKLVNGVDWGDGSGCQILLDSKHQIVSYYDEDAWGLDQTAIDALYEDITASVPADATPEIAVSSVMPNEVDSTFVDPGTYDVLVVYPTLEYEEFFLYLAGLDAGLFDDIEFEADYTYVFQTMADEWGGDDIIFITPVSAVVQDLDLTLGHCNLTEVEVSVVIANQGSQLINTCDAYYFVRAMDSDEDEEGVEYDTIREKITIPGGLAYGKTYTYTFTQKIDIDKDTAFYVWGGIEPLEGEIELFDNFTSNVFFRKPAVDVPHEFNLEENEIIFDQDKWLTGYIDEDNTVGLGSYEVGYPAVTSCINMEANKAYRLSFDGIYGYKLYDVLVLTANYGIKFGKVDEDMSQWQEVIYVEDAYTEAYEFANFVVTPEEDGQYAFCFYEDTSSMGGGIVLANITVTEVPAKDVKLNVFSGFPSMMPVEHANHTYRANYEVENWGSVEVEKVNLNIELNGTVIATQEVVLGESGKISKGTVELPVTGLTTAGVDAVFTATVELADDVDMSNNRLACTMKVTEDVMAYDFVTEEMYANYGIGVSGGSIACGIPFSIEISDTLTGVIFGWSGSATEDMAIGITVHKWNKDNETLGDMLYSTTYRRGVEAGARTYNLPAFILEAGDYIISAVQLGSTNYGLLSDATPEGFLYVTSIQPVRKQQGLGTPMIRAVFGHDGKPVAKDIFVSEITKPKEQGSFTANQEIVATVVNQGYEAVNAPVNVMVNGKLLSPKVVELAAYEKTEVTFVADLSAPDTEYVLKVFSALEGDEDPTNDTCTKIVRSLALSNPYVMDFEYCEDFAVMDEFVPAWTSVDLSGAYYAYGFNSVSYPHYMEPVGFMAVPDGFGSLMANGGERYGIVFGVGDEADEPVQSDAWLISPKLALTASNAEMSFAVKSATAEYGLERYNVMISTTDNNPESFVKVGETAQAPAEWTQVNVDLSEYVEKDVYVAIQCVSYDAFAFMVDDIVFGTVANEDVARLENRLSVYPNPATEMITIHAQEAVINQVAVFNISGMMVYQSDNLNTTDYRYSVKGLNAGIYFARVTTEQGTAVMKFVVR